MAATALQRRRGKKPTMSDDTNFTTDMTPPQDPLRRLTRAEASLNGARSRGPKTREGKLRSSRNAWKHGVTAKNKPVPDPVADPRARYSEPSSTTKTSRSSRPSSRYAYRNSPRQIASNGKSFTRSHWY